MFRPELVLEASFWLLNFTQFQVEKTTQIKTNETNNKMRSNEKKTVARMNKNKKKWKEKKSHSAVFTKKKKANFKFVICQYRVYYLDVVACFFTFFIWLAFLFCFVSACGSKQQQPITQTPNILKLLVVINICNMLYSYFIFIFISNLFIYGFFAFTLRSLFSSSSLSTSSWL